MFNERETFSLLGACAPEEFHLEQSANLTKRTNPTNTPPLPTMVSIQAVDIVIHITRIIITISITPIMVTIITTTIIMGNTTTITIISTISAESIATLNNRMAHIRIQLRMASIIMLLTLPILITTSRMLLSCWRYQLVVRCEEELSLFHRSRIFETQQHVNICSAKFFHHIHVR